LEHFPRCQTPAILREWLRALQPGGKLCLSVPDYDLILDIYRETNNDANFILPPLFGGQDYPFNFHFTTFNRVSLTHILLEAGFKTVEEWTHGKDHLHSLPDWSGRYIAVAEKKMPISLNLEATK
jgi:predicted SAM-dependent methyltransferase